MPRFLGLTNYLMTTKPTLGEAKADLEQTDRDITYLTNIVENLREFINNDLGRYQFRTDLMRYETTLDRGKQLRTKIKQVIKELTT